MSTSMLVVSLGKPAVDLLKMNYTHMLQDHYRYMWVLTQVGLKPLLVKTIFLSH